MRYKENKKKKSKIKEYSKRCIAAMIILWFLVALYGIGVSYYQLAHTLSPEMVMLDSLYAYVGIPMSGGIIGYLIKSAVENKEKIKGNVSSNEEILTQTYENMEGENNDTNKLEGEALFS